MIKLSPSPLSLQRRARKAALTFHVLSTPMLGSLQLLQPTTVDEASGALRDFAERGKIYAGGAELLLLMRHGLLQSEILVDVKKIERLHRYHLERWRAVGWCLRHSSYTGNSPARSRTRAVACLCGITGGQCAGAKSGHPGRQP